MRTAAALLATVLALTTASIASAQDAPANKAEARVLAKGRMINEYIDLGEYDTARDNLEASLEQLKAAGSAMRPIAADTHALLGVVYILGYKNTKKATEHFKAAIRINKKVTLPKQANDRAKVVFGKAYEALYPTINCDTLVGMSHRPLALAQEGKPGVIEAKLDKLLLDSSLQLIYRGPGGDDFVEVPMKRTEGCTFRGEIPAEDMVAPKVEYYLEARLKDGRPSARRGKAKKPYVINVSFGPVADAPEPEKSEETKQVEDDESVGKPDDEVEDLLLTKPKEPKGSGCAGCSAGREGGASWLLALGVVFVLGSRRRRD
jgi:MYXO-CTERM domain-containing protein